MLTKNRNMKLFVFSFLAIIVLASVAVAQGSGGQRRGHGPGDGNLCAESGGRAAFKVERLAKALDLSETQIQTLKEIQESRHQENTELRKDLMRLRNERRGEMLKDDPTEKAVLSLTEKIGDLKTQLQVNRVKARLAVRAQLTPEQRDKMLMMKAHRKNGGRGRGECGSDGRGERGERGERGGRHGRSGN